VARLFEELPLRARDAVADLPDDERRRLVVAVGDEEGRCRDLVEPIGDVPPEFGNVPRSDPVGRSPRTA
jgi:hypothetical protein